LFGASGLHAAWDLAAFDTAVASSHRVMKLSQEDFDAIQRRHRSCLKRIEADLKQRMKTADPRVLKAFAEVPREYFHYQYQKKLSLARLTWDEDSKPWAIGYGSALSDYQGQAWMTQMLDVDPKHTVLEIGTGSGYQISVLSRMAKEVYSIEIRKALGKAVDQIFVPLGYTNIHARVGDGFHGWPEVQGGFDRIMVTCAASYVPPPLIAQLKPNGIMVIPVGQPFKRNQVLYEVRKDAQGKVHTKKYWGVFFIPMLGDVAKGKK
jgi:protein-L-isoaspartate(D-aspartate) O-methyltransferase